MAETRNEAMQMAWDFVEGTSVSVFLTGKAGTGKTTFLRRLREVSPKRMVVVAPTGVAAINANGVTIHSFFQLPIGVHIPGVERKEGGTHFRMSQEKKNIMRTLDLLVIDEVSMVRADLLDAVDGVLRKYRDHSRPFGGVQLLLIGDLQQLPPVAQDSEWDMLKDYYDSPYFFSSRALRQVEYVTIELQHIYRQSDERFISLLANIRDGRLDESTVAALNARYVPGYVPAPDSGSIRLTTHNHTASAYNEQQLSALPTRPVSFEADVQGDFPETSYPADSHLVLKEGAQVMFIKNSQDGSYYNGKIGRVAAFVKDSVIVDSEGENIEVEPVVWDNTRLHINDETKEIEEEVIGTFRQLPLRLAWAITVHKSQGLTFDHAVLDINDSFAHGQAYVALSRCRTLDGMVLTRPLQLRSLAPDRMVTDFLIASEREAAMSAERLPDLRRGYFLTLLDQLFDFSAMQREIHYIVRVLQEHLAKQHPEATSSWMEASRRFDQDCVDVALRFKVQYRRIMAASQDWQDDPLLAQRIAKACAYFTEQLESFKTLFSLSDFSIGNKAVKSQWDNALAPFREDWKTKLGVMLRVQAHGFSVKTYLRDKAQALLGEDPSEVKNEKGKVKNRGDVGVPRLKRKVKSSKPKVPKEKTWEISMRLLKEGRSVDEIASERGLTIGTIYDHLTRYVEQDELDPSSFLPRADVQMVSQILQLYGKPETRGAFINSLPRALPYKEVALIFRVLGEEW